MGAGLEHISIESLEFIYENTFVTDQDRSRLGIHGTPYALARHVVHSLPFDRFALESRRVVEPCCGHGIFLVAALERLRELVHGGFGQSERHEYLKRMLWGFDTEPFSIEVASLCLSLADFPNGNGWNLKGGDEGGRLRPEELPIRGCGRGLEGRALQSPFREIRGRRTGQIQAVQPVATGGSCFGVCSDSFRAMAS